MININELRRLAQAATPHVGHACKYQDAHWLREGHVDFENADLFIASERPQEDAAFYAAANPATVIELLDRLEDAKSDALEQARLNGMGSEREAALMAKLEASERERDEVAQQLVQSEKGKRKISEECDALRAEVDSWKGLAAQFSKEADKAKTHLAFAKDELNHLRAKIEAMEKQEPTWQAIEARVTGAQPAQKAVAYLDLGVGGYTDIGTDLNDEQLASLPKGRHMLGIVGTYGVDGYVSAQPAPSFADAYQGAMEDVAIWKKRALEAEDLNRKFVAEINGPAYMGESAHPAPSIPEGWKLVPIEPTEKMINEGTCAATLPGPRYIDSACAKHCWEYMLAAAPEAKP